VIIVKATDNWVVRSGARRIEGKRENILPEAGSFPGQIKFILRSLYVP